MTIAVVVDDDNDGIPDTEDPDDDNDGIPDIGKCIYETTLKREVVIKLRQHLVIILAFHFGSCALALLHHVI